MFRFIKQWAKGQGHTKTYTFSGNSTETLVKFNTEHLKAIDPGTRKAFTRSILIRHLDVGSCNAEEAELVALGSPI